MADRSPTSLEDRFKLFLAGLEGAESIDDTLSDAELGAGKRADFLLDHRNIVLELKTLKNDPVYKVEQRLAQHRDREDFPVFYWRAPVDDVLGQLPDGENIRAQIYNALTKAVEGNIENADDQIADTAAALQLHRPCGVVAILNEDIDILDPKLLATRVSQIICKTRDGQRRHPNIGYVLLFSESHRLVAGQPSEHLPVILIEGPGAADHPRGSAYLDAIPAWWAEFVGVPLYASREHRNLDNLRFEARNGEGSAAEAPEQRPRHELWRRQYAEYPYLRALSDEDFLAHGGHVFTTMTPHFVKGGQKLPDSVVAELMEAWTHVLAEAEHRKLDMRKLQQYIRLPQDALNPEEDRPSADSHT